MINANLYRAFDLHATMVLKYYTIQNNELPNVKRYHGRFNTKKIDELIKIHFKDDSLKTFDDESFQKKFRNEKWELINSNYFCEIRKGLVFDYAGEQLTLCFSSSIKENDLNQLFEIFNSSLIIDKDNDHFSMIKKADYGDFELASFKIKKQDIKLNDNYNDDLIKIHPNIIKHLNSKKSHGIILFHGIPGAGKTTYIRNLISECTTRFIYVPNNLFNHISDPDFITFLSGFPDSIIILEDCEELLKSRSQNDNSNNISSILNLGDGLLGDALKLKIICTFNLELNKIDDALLRKGRLAYRYEFKPLETKKANMLAKKLKIKQEILNPITLAEIYNLHHDNNNQINDKKNIGFSK